jgi:hypothetical protein
MLKSALHGWKGQFDQPSVDLKTSFYRLKKSDKDIQYGPVLHHLYWETWVWASNLYTASSQSYQLPFLSCTFSQECDMSPRGASMERDLFQNFSHIVDILVGKWTRHNRHCGGAQVRHWNWDIIMGQAIWRRQWREAWKLSAVVDFVPVVYLDLFKMVYFGVSGWLLITATCIVI